MNAGDRERRPGWRGRPGIGASDLPRLEHLELWLGTENYGGNVTVEDLGPILLDRFPSLRRLGLRNAEGVDAIAEAVANAPVTARIEVLDLSMGDLGDEGTGTLAASPGVAGLKKVDIHHHFVSDEAIAGLRGLGIEVEAGDRQEPHEWGGEKHKPYDPKSGEGVVGKNYAYQTMSSVNVFFDDKILNPFIGAGALATVIDDYNGDNFDHSGLGFIGGAYVAGMVTGGRPIEMIYTPQGTPAWGMEWKHAAAKNYLKSFSISCHGSNMSSRGNYLDLDPTYRDIHGRPMLRMTFDFNGNDHKMSDYLTDRAAEVARAMNPREIKLNRRIGSWNVVPYQTTHNTGGAIMGDNPSDSVVNKYLQSWDVPNVFSMGAGAFPQNAGYNPTGTVAALALSCGA